MTDLYFLLPKRSMSVSCLLTTTTTRDVCCMQVGQMVYVPLSVVSSAQPTLLSKLVACKRTASRLRCRCTCHAWLILESVLTLTDLFIPWLVVRPTKQISLHCHLKTTIKTLKHFSFLFRTDMRKDFHQNAQH